MEMPSRFHSKASTRPFSRSLGAFPNGVFSVDISSENRNVASASFDGTIRLWAKNSPLSPRLLPNSAFMAPASEFSIQDSHISVTGNGGKTYSATLPEQFGEISAAAVSANGRGIAVVPRSVGQPVLLVNPSDSLITVKVLLCGVSAEWTAVAFIENDTLVAASTKEGKTFAWPFYFDVGSLEQLANEHLPLVRDENGLDKRLELHTSLLRR